MPDPTVNSQPEQQQNNPIEDQIRLENARKARVEAESRAEKLRGKHARQEQRRSLFSSIAQMNRALLGAMAVAIVAAVIFVPTVVVPLVTNKPAPITVSTSMLERVVEVSELSTVDYGYRGLAPYYGPLNVFRINPDCWVKYEAHVQASFDMAKIKFELDEENKTVTALLPEPKIGTPVLDAKELDYMPSGVQAELQDIHELCVQDAAAEIDKEGEIRERAYANLQRTIEALTLPILGDEYSLEFKRMTLASTVTDAAKEQLESAGSDTSEG